MIDAETALVVCRFLFDCAVVFLWGSSAFLGILAPRALGLDVVLRLRVWQGLGVLLTIGATVALLPLRAATIGDGWRDAFDAEMLSAVLFQTDVGLAWLAQAGAVVLMVLCALFARFPQGQISIAVSSGLAMATLSLIGHAQMNAGWLGFLHPVNDMAHVLSAGFWLGALVPVLLVLPYLHEIRLADEARQALYRFSTVGHFAVAAAILSGLANSYLVVGNLPLNWSLRYQALLAIKIALVALMAALALVNRYCIAPRLAQPQFLSVLIWATRIEATCGVIVLMLVAWFGTLDPS